MLFLTSRCDKKCDCDINVSECEQSREASVELIKLDVSRTFPQLCIFQKVIHTPSTEEKKRKENVLALAMEARLFR